MDGRRARGQGYKQCNKLILGELFHAHFPRGKTQLAQFDLALTNTSFQAQIFPLCDYDLSALLPVENELLGSCV